MTYQILIKHSPPDMGHKKFTVQLIIEGAPKNWNGRGLPGGSARFSVVKNCGRILDFGHYVEVSADPESPGQYTAITHVKQYRTAARAAARVRSIIHEETCSHIYYKELESLLRK